MSGVLNLQKGREMGNSSGESGLQARWSVVVPCTRRVPYFGVFVVFSVLLFRRISKFRAPDIVGRKPVRFLLQENSGLSIPAGSKSGQFKVRTR